MSTSLINIVDGVVSFRGCEAFTLKTTDNLINDLSLVEFFDSLADVSSDKKLNVERIENLVDMVEENDSSDNYDYIRDIEQFNEKYLLDFVEFSYDGIDFCPTTNDRYHFYDYNRAIDIETDSLGNVYIIDAFGKSRVIGTIINKLVTEQFIDWFEGIFLPDICSIGKFIDDKNAENDDD